MLPLYTIFFALLYACACLQFCGCFGSSCTRGLDPGNIFCEITNGKSFATSNGVIYVFVMIFILLLFCVFASRGMDCVMELGSETSFIAKEVTSYTMFTFLFSFLVRTIDMITTLVYFSAGLVLRSGFLRCSTLRLLALFLFCFETKLIVLSFKVVVSAGITPVVAVTLVFARFFTSMTFVVDEM